MKRQLFNCDMLTYSDSAAFL